MRAVQLSDLQEVVGRQPGAARDIVDQLSELQREATEGRETARSRVRSIDVGWTDLAIGVLSVLLAVLAWRRDRGKSRQELLDGAVFLALGGLERYLAMRQRSEQ